MNQQMHRWSTIYYTALFYTAPTYLRNLAGSEYELPEDDTIASKRLGAV
jgi:hypothetical protein